MIRLLIVRLSVCEHIMEDAVCSLLELIWLLGPQEIKYTIIVLKSIGEQIEHGVRQLIVRLKIVFRKIRLIGDIANMTKQMVYGLHGVIGVYAHPLVQEVVEK